MASIFVIEQGSYSDYHVVGVFSSRENAQMVLDKINASEEYCYDKGEIAEWPLDPAVDALHQGLTRFRVEMLKDGVVEKCERVDAVSYYGLAEEFTEWNREEAMAYRGKNIPNLLQAFVWAEDEKHAIKITNERRIQMLALGQWKGKL